ncbi:MAG TPA: AMP-binding protein, partial [Marmoricola sp.]|nr:AMP-binding protein [Marmoricola sp.]
MTRPLNLADIIEVMADSVPDRMAFISDAGNRTYAELDDNATRLANHLIANGIHPGDHVAVHAANGPEWAEAFYGVQKARAVPINVNFRYVHDELSYLYDNCQAVAAIVGEDYADVVRGLNAATLRHILVIGEEYDAALAAASDVRPEIGRSEDDHYIVYTGGTTGMPKGVVWRQEDVILGALNELRYRAPIESVEKLGEEAAANANPLRMMVCGPLMHGGSQWTMCNSHVGGAVFTLYCGSHFDPEAVLDLVESSGTNSLALLGDAMARPVMEALAANPDRWDLSALF